MVAGAPDRSLVFSVCRGSFAKSFEERTVTLPDSFVRVSEAGSLPSLLSSACSLASCGAASQENLKRGTAIERESDRIATVRFLTRIPFLHRVAALASENGKGAHGRHDRRYIHPHITLQGSFLIYKFRLICRFLLELRRWRVSLILRPVRRVGSVSGRHRTNQRQDIFYALPTDRDFATSGRWRDGQA
jgi:hypothetical protein